MKNVVALIQQLTGAALRADSAAGLFGAAFATLFQHAPFEVAVAVMIEQNLDLYISTREGGEALVDDALVARIRGTLQAQFPMSFTTTDIIVQSERHDLPSSPELRTPNHELHVVLRVEHRTAGLLLLYRDTAFTDDERDLAEIFATQVSLLLGNLNARQRILNLADTDDLTGIWNKRYFRRLLPQEVERARVYNVPLSLLMFDIDEFKQINDSFGHTAGDVVLSELCGAVREMLRPPDFFARFGGDEFAIVLPHTDLAGACSVAQRIMARVGSLTIPTDEEGAIRCSISIGVASYELGESAHDLVRRADERLYASKRAGKNRYTAK